jgi:hypothetical protein
MLSTAELRKAAGDRALAALGHDQRVVHTGQHYDERMSEVSSSSPACPGRT